MKYIQKSGVIGSLFSWFRRHPLLASNILFWVFIVTLTYFVIRSSDVRNRKFANVLVSSRTIAQGEVIASDMLASTRFMEGSIPQNALSSESLNDVVGKTALVTLGKGEVITPSVVNTSAGATLRLASVLGGQKVMALTPTDVHTIPPTLEVGDRLTIYIIDVKANSKNVLTRGVDVIQVVKSGEEDNKDEILSFVVTLDDEEILNISEALAKENFLQIALDVGN